MATVVHPDPFSAVLLSSPPLVVTEEQSRYIREVLDISCSDSKFAEKAYTAITRILSGGSIEAPTLTSVNPSTGMTLTSVTITAMGTNFTPGSKIVVSGVEQETTFVSETELNALVALGEEGVLPVAVLTDAGVLTDSVPFTVTALGRSSDEKVYHKPDNKVQTHQVRQ
jgi:hypothetical protein